MAIFTSLNNGIQRYIFFLFLIVLLVLSGCTQSGGAIAVVSATQVSSGSHHTCASTDLGGVRCWGDNRNYGQIGDGTYKNRDKPVDVSMLDNGVTAVSAGDTHTCALTNEGSVKCWGSNYFHQLGDGTDDDNRPTPADVNGLNNGIQDITAGDNHTCALTTSGGVKCWGDNTHGRLGDGTNSIHKTPVNVVGLNDVKAISAGGGHTCALTNAGGVKCWGWNRYGQLGVGATNTDINIPVDVVGLSSGVLQIAAGYSHTCALMDTRNVKCWGNNNAGQLGNGTNNNQTLPTDVLGLSNNIVQISAGGYHTCAVTTVGGVKCWGQNGQGQIGDGRIDVSEDAPPVEGGNFDRYTPVDVVGLTSGVTAVSAGHFHTCVLMDTGGVKCWGADSAGQLGNGAISSYYSTPVDAIGFNN